MERAKPPMRRCAVYTRKSSEEGLEQDFGLTGLLTLATSPPGLQIRARR